MTEFQLTHPPPIITKRADCDYYPTPSWCVRLLLDACPPPGDVVLEPSAGEGGIVSVLVERGLDVIACEVRPECWPALFAAGALEVIEGDFLTVAPPTGFPIIGNPPYTHAVEHADRCLRSGAPYVALLLRLGFLESETRAAWNNAHPPTQLLVLGKRPSFTNEGKTDGTAYAWFIWEPGKPPRAPRVLLP